MLGDTFIGARRPPCHLEEPTCRPLTAALVRNLNSSLGKRLEPTKAALTAIPIVLR